MPPDEWWDPNLAYRKFASLKYLAFRSKATREFGN